MLACSSYKAIPNGLLAAQGCLVIRALSAKQRGFLFASFALSSVWLCFLTKYGLLHDENMHWKIDPEPSKQTLTY